MTNRPFYAPALALVLLTVSLGSAAPSPAAQGAWEGLALGDIRAVYLYEPGCPFCARFEKETLADARVKAGMARLEFVRVNAFTEEAIAFQGREIPQLEIAARYKVYFYPTVLFLGPDGREISRIKGFFETPDFLEMLRYITDEHFRRESFAEYLDRMARQRP